ncbi:DNA alkylation repair protein [Persicitalea sp.]|uniref:DNA alkylation repair protein n=1 Tax=Persicitalea sp. TaxID=3100273 RepID=UPI003592FDD3
MQDIRSELAELADEDRSRQVSRFFQNGPGQYAEGDVFWGIPNPKVREVAKRWTHLNLKQVEKLLRDPIHECRFAALLIWLKKYPKATAIDQQAIFDSYLTHLEYINNWDLVDISAPHIVGHYLFDKDREVLYDLASRPHLWSQRVAIISTFHFIRKNQFTDTLALSKILLSHPHHLIHKAIGWMLREVGKRDLDSMEAFLHEHTVALPRTSLRYAIEKLPPSRRQYYLTL